MPSARLRPRGVQEVFRGRLIRVEVQDWPDGQREVVRHPGACGVVAVTARDEVLLVRQVRESVGEVLLEIPAGVFDVEGEDAAGCAARELLEETGHRATSLDPLATIYTTPGFTDERIELFLARAEPASGGGEPGVEVVPVPFGEAVAAAREGRIRDAKTICALLLAAARKGG